jgi:lysophospholipase L1-like esterase
MAQRTLWVDRAATRAIMYALTVKGAALRTHAVILLTAAIASACSGPSTPTVVDPGVPTISCPAAPNPAQATDSTGAIVVFGASSASGGTPPLTGPTCNFASGSKFPIGTTTVTCTVSDAKGRAAAPCSFQVVVTPAPAPPKVIVTRFVAFGDSITWGEDGTNPSISPAETGRLHPAVQLPVSDTYPGALEADLRARYTTQTPTVANAGQRDEAASDPSAFSRFVFVLSNNPSDIVLIMEGANDIASRDSHIFPAVIAGLQKMIDYAKGRGMRVMLATIPPENPTGIRGLGWSLVPGLNEQIRALAASENVALVDVYQAFGGDVTTLIGFDGLHPTALGYHRIADTFFATVKSALEVPSSTTGAPSFTPYFAPPRRR